MIGRSKIGHLCFIYAHRTWTRPSKRSHRDSLTFVALAVLVVKRLERMREREQQRPRGDGVDDDYYSSDFSEDDVEALGEEAWRNSEGERLNDFGVDEDAEFYDEDEVPLAQLVKRKSNQVKTKAQ